MNIQQEGLGGCKTCGGPVMQAINQPGIKGVCLGCQAAAEPKTGRTVVVTSETGEGTAMGSVKLQQVEHNPGAASALPSDPQAVRKAVMDKANAKGVTPVQPIAQSQHDGSIWIKLTLEDIADRDLIRKLLQATYDALDNMPPGATLKETKRMIKIQESIETLMKKENKKHGNTDSNEVN